MAVYSMAVRTTNTTINNANVEIIAAATNKPKLMELGFAQVTGTASSYGFGRPAATGVTPTTPVNLVDEADGDSAVTGLTTTALAWGTSPTAPAVYARRINTPATVGAGVIWTFPRGFAIPKTKSLVVFNVTATVALDVWVVVDE